MAFCNDVFASLINKIVAQGYLGALTLKVFHCAAAYESIVSLTTKGGVNRSDNSDTIVSVSVRNGSDQQDPSRDFVPRLRIPDWTTVDWLHKKRGLISDASNLILEITLSKTPLQELKSEPHYEYEVYYDDKFTDLPRSSYTLDPALFKSEKSTGDKSD